MKKGDKPKRQSKPRSIGDPILRTVYSKDGLVIKLKPHKDKPSVELTPEMLAFGRMMAGAYAKEHNFTMRISTVDAELLNFLVRIRDIGKSEVIRQLLWEEYDRCVKTLQEKRKREEDRPEHEAPWEKE